MRLLRWATLRLPLRSATLRARCQREPPRNDISGMIENYERKNQPRPTALFR